MGYTDHQVNLHRKFVKKALKKGNLSDSFMVGKYACSPYMACGHGCTYCDGRAERYYVEGDFEKDIVVRPNLPELLEGELPRLRERGVITLGSGITDAYQPVEREEGVTRRTAEVLARFDYPVTLLTKSSLPLRDLDFWKKVNDKGGFTLLVSLTHTDDATRKQFEPGASPVEERLELLKAFKEAGCSTGILAMPLLPGITDGEDHIRRLYDLAAETGVDFLAPGGLTLRPGRQKDFFLSSVSAYYPGKSALYRKIYGENRASGISAYDYRKELLDRMVTIYQDYGLPPFSPHGLFRGKIHIYDEVSVLLQHMVELYRNKNINTKPLERSLDNYRNWLHLRKKVYNRRPSLSYTDLEGELKEASCRDGLAALLGNRKLARFLSSVILERKTFDYVTLELS